MTDGRASATARLGEATSERAAPAGVRVVMDVRALQEPTRAPRTAAYLDGLLGAFDAVPLEGESFAFLLASDEGDPTQRYRHLSVIGRRLLPPTRLLRSAAAAVDPFLLRGASFGAAWRAEARGATGAVYHTAAGGLPIASRLPTVVSVLDLAPWEVPDAFGRTAAARFGLRLRTRLLRHAAAVLVGTDSVARSARTLVHVRRDRIRVVPLAPRPEFVAVAGASKRLLTPGRSIVRRLGLGERYLVYPGRYDVRQDAATLLRAMASLARAGRPAEIADEVGWPPRLLVIDATPDDRAALARVAARHDAGDHLVYAPAMTVEESAAIVAGSRGVVIPAIADASGSLALDAISAGVPVIASAVGALPEIVGTAGILVEPRDPDRLAAALAAAWGDGPVRAGIAGAARDRAASPRSWVDVAADVRAIYAEVSRPSRL